MISPYIRAPAFAASIEKEKLVNHSNPSARLRAIFVAFALCSAVGCNQASSGSATVSPKACADYATRMCKEAGEESATCTSVKAATDLMPPAACAAALADIGTAIKKLGEKNKKCNELVTKLCTDLGQATESCKMVTTQTKGFPPDRCEMMLSKYPEVLADLQRQEAKNQPLNAEKIAKISTADAPAFGPAGAKVTIVEFSDFECPFCSRAADAAHAIKAKYSDKVRFVFRQFPLPFHPNAHVAAEASLAANAQGKFWEFHDKMFANQKALDRPSLEGFAKEVGLDVSKFKQALDQKTYAATVDAEMKLGEEVAVDGTPTMFLNGARVANPTDVAAISAQIDQVLAAAGG